jgi:hypothetical protein
MRARLLAIVSALTAAGLGAGALVFVQWNEPHSIEHVVLNMQDWPLMDSDSCVPRACGLQACVTAQNHLTDAGTGCVTRLVACDWRITQRMRDAAAESGATLGPKKYQRLEIGTLRCPGRDGGFTWAVPLDDAGWPIVADVAEVTPRCVRAPLDGGQLCRRSERDGGFRYFGAGNVFPASESNGHASCEPCGCAVMSGDNAEVDL